MSIGGFRNGRIDLDCPTCGNELLLTGFDEARCGRCRVTFVWSQCSGWLRQSHQAEGAEPRFLGIRDGKLVGRRHLSWRCIVCGERDEWLTGNASDVALFDAAISREDAVRSHVANTGHPIAKQSYDTRVVDVGVVASYLDAPCATCADTRAFHLRGEACVREGCACVAFVPMPIPRRAQ